MKILKEPKVSLVAMTLPVEVMAGGIYLDIADVPKEGGGEEAWSTDLIIPADTAARVIEAPARNCYRSESKGSPEEIVAKLATNKHGAMLEFVDATFKVTCDRMTSAQLERHRIMYLGEASSCQEGASFAQESTRYCNYSKEKFDGQVTFCDPHFQGLYAEEFYRVWEERCRTSERDYLEAVAKGAKPEDARAFLNPYLATCLYMKTNLRDWRHFIELRNDPKHAHHNAVAVASKILPLLKMVCPVLFP